jgi:hypothetical protein
MHLSTKLSLIESQQLVADGVVAAVALKKANDEALKIAEEKNIPIAEARRILLSASIQAKEDQQRRTAEKLGIIMEDAVNKLAEDLERLPPKEIPKVLSKAMEVKQLLENKPTSISERKHTIGGKTAEELRERLAKMSQGAIEVESEVLEEKPTKGRYE